MTLAVAAMDPTVRFIFFLLALACFVIAAFATPKTRFPVSWVALGLALFTVPWMWDALAAA